MTDEERKALVERLLDYGVDAMDDNIAVCDHKAVDQAADQIEADGKRIAELEEQLEYERGLNRPLGSHWQLGDKVQKKRGSKWRGVVCGFYSTPHTPEGYCVDSAFETGSVQVWPLAALEDWDGE